MCICAALQDCCAEMAWHVSVQYLPRLPASTSEPWGARSWTRPPRRRRAMQQVSAADCRHNLPIYQAHVLPLATQLYIDSST